MIFAPLVSSKRQSVLPDIPARPYVREICACYVTVCDGGPAYTVARLFILTSRRAAVLTRARR